MGRARRAAANGPDTGSPQFTAAVLDFIGSARQGTATDSPLTFAFACWLAGSWESALVDLRAARTGESREEAQEWFARMLGEQRAMWHSLAAMPRQESDGGD